MEGYEVVITYFFVIASHFLYIEYLKILQVIGNGSFGVVYQAKLCESGEMVAIKKVLQDKRFKNRELQIMRRLEHCNIVKLMYFFYTSGETPGRGEFDFLVRFLEATSATRFRSW